jgi:UPF0716 family protein affecting phage T7 exclusion
MSKRIFRRRLMICSYRLQKKSQRYLSPALRALLGILFIIGGVLGFMPVLGFWMIPLGLGLLATDIPPLKRCLHRRLKTR